MATLYLKAAGGNWTTAGTWSNVSSAGGDSSGPPTAADDCVADAGSGAVTIDSGAVCRSLDCTGYVGTATHNAITWTIGDGTAGAGNIALKLVAGMTYTLVNAATSAISFISTSSTQQTVAFGGKTHGNLTFNSSSNGDYAVTSAMSCGSTATVTVTKGTVHFDGPSDNSGLSHSIGIFSSSNSNVRTINLGTCTLTCVAGGTSFTLLTTTNLTFTASSSTVTLTGAAALIQTGSQTFGTLNFTGSGTAVLSKTTGVDFTCSNLNRTGTASKTDVLRLSGSSSASYTVSNTLTLAGNSATNRLLVADPNALNASKTITCNGTVTASNVDFRDISGAGSASWDLSAITGGSGDCGGNVGITFTTGVTLHWQNASSSSWSTASNWDTSPSATSRVPLSQDNVAMDKAFGTSQTVTLDMPRAGKSIDWTGATWTTALTWANTTATTMYGGMTLISGLTNTGTTAFTLEGRGSFTWTSAGVTFTNPVTIAMVGGTLTLQDALNISGATSLTHTDGTLVDNGQTITLLIFVSSGTRTRVVTKTGSWTITGASGTPWSVVSTGLTFTDSSGTITLSDVGGTNKIFAGGGVTTYGALTITGAGAGVWTFTGSNTFTTLTINSPKTVKFTAGTTTTVTTFTATGTAGNLITMDTDTGASTWSLSKSSGYVNCDYLSLTRSTATGGALFYAGKNSTNGGSNTGWIFGDQVYNDGALNFEDLLTINGSGILNLEYLNTINGDGSINFENLLILNSNGALNFEDLLTINADGSTNYENLLTLNGDGQTSLEYLLSINSSGILNFEYLLGLNSDGTVNFENLVGINANGEIPLEYLLSLNSNGILNYEYLVGLNSDGALTYESLLIINADAQIPYEFQGGISSAADLSLEWLATVQGNGVLNYESLISVGVTASTLTEWLLTVNAEGTLLYEALLKVNGDAIIPIEWMGDIPEGIILQWVLDNRKTLWVLGSRGTEWVLPERGVEWVLTRR